MEKTSGELQRRVQSLGGNLLRVLGDAANDAAAAASANAANAAAATATATAKQIAADSKQPTPSDLVVAAAQALMSAGVGGVAPAAGTRPPASAPPASLLLGMLPPS